MIDLYTWTTPNGRKISIMLEETGLPYRVIPVDLTKEQQQWYVGLFKQVYDSPDWQDFVQKNALDAQFLASDEFARFLDEYEKLHKELMTAAGWLQ